MVWQGTDTSESTGTKNTRTTFSYNDQGRLHQVLTQDFTATPATQTRVTYENGTQGIRITALEEADTDGAAGFETSRETRFLVDHHNQTGYAQTFEQTTVDPNTSNILDRRVYTLGHDELTQATYTWNDVTQDFDKGTQTFLHDGHGSTRVLLNATAAIAQIFTYSAYGNLLAIHNATATLHSTNPAAALTALLYSGEFFDSTINQQYLRARWYDPTTARFNRLDPFAGNIQDPQSLHKYLYTHTDPVNYLDPSGMQISICGALAGIGALGFVAGFTVTYIATEGDIGAALLGGVATALFCVGVAVCVGVAAMLLGYVGWIVLGYSFFASTTFNSFMLGSAATGYFIWDTGQQFEHANTEAEVLALEVQLGFLVVGWAVGLGFTAKNSSVNIQVRNQYVETSRSIGPLNQQWKAAGEPLVSRAFKAWEIRHQALVQARAAMFSQADVELLKARNSRRYGHPEGLNSWERTVEFYRSKGYEGDALYEAILKGSEKTNQAINNAMEGGKTS